MVIREVPAIGHWMLIIGLILPFLGYAGLSDYNSTQSFVWNAEHQVVVVPFLKGSNPLPCLSDSVRELVTVPFGFTYKPEPGCTTKTIVPYSVILFLSLVFMLIGLYFHLRKHELANLWPTEWTPFDPNNAKKKPEGKKKNKEINVQHDGPIKPHEGGF